MRGDTNFEGSDSSDPTVYFLYCDYVLNIIQRTVNETTQFITGFRQIQRKQSALL